MDSKVRAWRNSGKHLPPIMRDFHDQKEIFKTCHAVTQPQESKELKDLSWIDAHIYTIDFFLWFMARHGYTLQRSRAHLEFDDLEQTIAARQGLETKALQDLLSARNGETKDG